MNFPPKTILTLAPPVWPNLPPLGIAFLQGYAAGRKLAVDLFDLNNFFYNLANDSFKKQWLISCNKNWEETVFSLLKPAHAREWKEILTLILSYDVIGFSCFKSNLKTTLELIDLIKQRRPAVRIALGGPEIARQFFKAGGAIPDFLAGKADCIVVGEGELPFFNYLSGRETKKIALFAELPDLHNLSFPTYDGLDLSLYPKKNTLPLQFSRGCIRQCRFCAERLLHKGFKSRPVESLISEMEYHRRRHSTRSFIFFDSLINADLAGLEELCDAIIGRFGQTAWEAQIAVRSHMPDRLFHKMKQSGCYNLFVGLESGSDAVLKRMHKGFTTRQAREFLEKLRASGLAYGISLITGYPGETEEEFRQSLDFVIDNKTAIPKIEQLNPFTYYEGTAVPRGIGRPSSAQAMERVRVFTEALKRRGIKYTKAYIGNLVEK